MVEQQNQQLLGGDEINLLDYWRVIWKRKILIGIICPSIVLGTMFYSFTLPKVYKSTATLLPIQGDGGGGGFMSNPAVSNLAPFLGISTSSPSQNFVLSILKSRLIVEKIIEQFNLKDYYKSLYLDSTINSLKGATKISSSSKEGIITIEVEDKNPKMAADIANAYIDHLNRLNSQFGTGVASRQRHFIAEQLARTEKNLKVAEDALKEFQEKHRAVSITDQARGAIEAAANLKGQIVTSEVQLQAMRNFAKDSHPDVINLKRRIDELKRQLAQSQYSTGLDLPPSSANPGHLQKEIYLPVANVPQVGLELARLTRDVKIQETVYTLLTQELEKAKIDEVKDMPVVQLLDRAVPARNKSKPSTKKNMEIALALSLFLGVFSTFILEYIDRQGGIKKLAKIVFSV